MKWKKWIEGINETLLDLWIGTIVYSLIFEIIGLIVVENKGSYSLGLWIGTAVAVFLAWNMYRSLEICLDMERKSATISMTVRSVLRMLVMLAVAWIALKSQQISLPGVIIGLIGLKMAAHFHVYTNVYITKKIRRKGGRS